MITTLNIPGGISPIPNAYLGFLSDTAITVLSKIMEVWYNEKDEDGWMKISSTAISNGLAKDKHTILNKLDDLVALNIIEAKPVNKRVKLYKLNWQEINFDCEVISYVNQDGKNKLWNACFVNENGNTTPLSKVKLCDLNAIVQQYPNKGEFLTQLQERLVEIYSLGYKNGENFTQLKKDVVNFHTTQKELGEFLTQLQIPMSNELCKKITQLSGVVVKNNTTQSENGEIFTQLSDEHTNKSHTPIVEWSKNDTTIEIHVSEALQDALFDIGLDNVRIKLRSDAGCIAVFQQKKEKTEEQEGKERKKEKNLPPYPYLIKEINKEKAEQEEKKEKKLMASAARLNKGGKNKNVLQNDEDEENVLGSFLEGRSGEQPSCVFSILRSWAEDRSCEKFEKLPGFDFNNILTDPKFFNSSEDILIRNTWNDIQGLMQDSADDIPGIGNNIIPVAVFKNMLYRVMEEQYETNPDFKLTEQDAKNIFGFELTEQDGEPCYVITSSSIRDITRPIGDNFQVEEKQRTVFDHAAERAKKLVFSDCMAEVGEDKFTRAEKAIRYMTRYVEKKEANKTPRADEMSLLQFPDFLQEVSDHTGLPVEDLGKLFARFQKKKRVGKYYLKFNLLQVDEIIKFNHDHNEKSYVEELYNKKMAEQTED